MHMYSCINLLNVLPCVLYVHNRTFPYATEIQESGVRMFAIGVTQGIIEDNVRNLSSPQVISSSSTLSSITCMTATISWANKFLDKYVMLPPGSACWRHVFQFGARTQNLTYWLLPNFDALNDTVVSITSVICTAVSRPGTDITSWRTKSCYWRQAHK